MFVTRQRSLRSGHSVLPAHPILMAMSFLLTLTLLFSPLLPLVSAAPAPDTAPVVNVGAPAWQMEPQTVNTTHTVCATGCDFTLIQDALDDSAVVDGDTLMVLDAVHTEGHINVQKNVTIMGQGAKETIVQGKASLDDPHPGASTIFRINAGTAATISDMTIRHATLTYESVETINLQESSVDDDVTQLYDSTWVIQLTSGAVDVQGDLTLANSVITDNTYVISRTIAAQIESRAPMTATAGAELSVVMVGYTGGVGLYNSGNLTVTHSTIANNHAWFNTDIYGHVKATGGVITQVVSATTVNEVMGAAILNEGTMVLEHSTVSGNRAYVSNNIDVGHDPVWPPPNLPPERLSLQTTTPHAGSPVHLLTEIGPDGITTSNEPLDIAAYLPDDLDFTSETQVATFRATLGGVMNEGDMTVRFSTITDNFAGGENVVSDNGTHISMQEDIGGLALVHNYMPVTLQNSILGPQIAGDDCFVYTMLSNGYNMDSDGSCQLRATGDLGFAGILLGPLEDNGGPTPTHALLWGSAGIDAADPTCDGATTDQRGEPRPVDGDGQGGARCDMGAVESTFETDVAVTGAASGQTQQDGQAGIAFEVTPGEVTAGGRLTYTLAVENLGPRASESIAYSTTVEMTVPEALQAGNASISATQGSCDATLPADRTDPLHCDLGDLHVGDVVTITVGAETASSLPDGETVTSEVTVSSVMPGEVAIANNETALSATANRRVDVQVSNEQSPGMPAPAQPVSYTVRVANEGPSDADGVVITGTLGTLLAEGQWTCSATGGAVCPQAQGSGDLEQTANLPAASTLVFIIDSELNGCGSFETVAGAVAANDTYAANDSAAVSNTMYCAYLMPLLNGVGEAAGR